MAKNDEREVLAADENDHAELRVYELGFHIDPELGAEEAKKSYEVIREAAAKGGSVIAEGEPTKIPLAYTVSRSEPTGRRDFTSAYFAWVAYEADGAGHEAVVEAAKGESRIIRFLDIRTTKEAAKHSAEMAELYAKLPDANAADAATEEDVSEVELDAALKEAGAA